MNFEEFFNIFDMTTTYLSSIFFKKLKKSYIFYVYKKSSYYSSKSVKYFENVVLYRKLLY